MKAKHRVSLIGLGGLVFLFHAFDANAALATASVTLDWSTFSVAYIPDGSNPSPSITWSDLSSNTSSRITSSSTSSDPFQYAPDWSTSLTTHAGNAAVFSDANITATTLHSYSEDSDLSANSFPNSQSYRNGSFGVSGSGTLVFSVNYILDAVITSGVSATPSTPNQATSAALIYVSNLTSNALVTAEELLSLIPGGTIGSPAHQEGTLSLSLLVNDGEQYSFLAGAQTNANVSAVPVPAAIWMFSSGLTLIFLKRRQS